MTCRNQPHRGEEDWIQGQGLDSGHGPGFVVRFLKFRGLGFRFRVCSRAFAVNPNPRSSGEADVQGLNLNLAYFIARTECGR